MLLLLQFVWCTFICSNYQPFSDDALQFDELVSCGCEWKLWYSLMDQLWRHCSVNAKQERLWSKKTINIAVSLRHNRVMTLIWCNGKAMMALFAFRTRVHFELSECSVLGERFDVCEWVTRRFVLVGLKFSLSQQNGSQAYAHKFKTSMQSVLIFHQPDKIQRF